MKSYEDWAEDNENRLSAEYELYAETARDDYERELLDSYDAWVETQRDRLTQEHAAFVNTEIESFEAYLCGSYDDWLAMQYEAERAAEPALTVH